MERPPKLQPGYGSDDDKWLLYSKKFDAPSAAARNGLLQEYGYLPAGAEMLSHAKAELMSGRGSAAAPPLGLNVKVTPDDAEFGSRGQSETSIAASGNNVVVGYDDSGRRVSYSPDDGGATRRQSHLPLFPSGASFGDPAVVAGPDGRFYHAFLAVTGAGAFAPSAVAVSRSDDSGATWNPPVNATAQITNRRGLHDKEWLAVDNTPGSPFRGNLYVSWTRFGLLDRDSIRLVRSTDGGQTWSQSVVLTELSPSEQPNHTIQLSFVATGPDRVDGIRVRKSRDGGVTFSEPMTALFRISFVFSISLVGPVNVRRYNSTVPTISTGSPPSMALDVNENPHLVWAAIGAPVCASDIFYARSRTGGRSFEPVVNVSRGFDTFITPRQPSLAVDTKNNVYVVWSNVDLDFAQGDILMARSTDGVQFTTINNLSFATFWKGKLTDWPAIGFGGNGVLTPSGASGW